MKRSTSLMLVALLVLVAFSAGALLAKGKGLRHLNLAGRSDDRPYSHAVVAGETVYVAGSIGVDPATGVVIDAHHPLCGESIAGRVVMMPTSRGSCTGSGVLLGLAFAGAAPRALIFREGEDILTLGALIAGRLFGHAIAVLDHRGNLVGRIDVDEREGHLAEESLARQPQHDRGVLADGPQHAEVSEVLPGLAQDVDALIFEVV